MRNLRNTSIIIGFLTVQPLCNADVNNDTQHVKKIITRVYQQRTRKFTFYKSKASFDVVKKYYLQFFTAATSDKLAKTVQSCTQKGITDVGPFGGLDPRFKTDLGGIDDPDSGADEINIEDVQKITYYTPTFKNGKAMMAVEYSLKKSKEFVSRSEYYLNKENGEWKIFNIIWGPKDNFAEPDVFIHRIID